MSRRLALIAGGFSVLFLSVQPAAARDVCYLGPDGKLVCLQALRSQKADFPQNPNWRTAPSEVRARSFNPEILRLERREDRPVYRTTAPALGR